MNKKYIITGIVLVCLLALLYFLPRSATPGNYEITSDDGALTLSIPQNALPEGLTAKDITIEKIASPELPEILGDIKDSGGVFEGYRLLPNGITLREPAQFTLTSADPGVNFYLLFHISGAQDENVDLIDNTTVNVDLETGDSSVSGDISHFSKILIRKGKVGPAEITLAHPAEIAVPDAVPLDISIIINKKEFDYWVQTMPAPWLARNDPDVIYNPNGESSLKITYNSLEESNSGKPILSPQTRQTFSNVLLNLTPENPYETTNNAFACAKKGTTSILVRGTWELITPLINKKTGVSAVGRAGSWARKAGFLNITTHRFSCVESAGGAGDDGEDYRAVTPYTIDCGKGKFAYGSCKVDPVTGEVPKDAEGNCIDTITNKAPSCD